ncbi:MAG: DUF1343 domain-containing protein [Candidatus Marinimicrobia bacterium]|nr:DUF1343 domain-containing protein [Candidatus Neomarinimicrobiota bacterium]
MFKTENRFLLLLLLPLFLLSENSSFQNTKIINYKPSTDSLKLHLGIDLLTQNDFNLLKKKKIAVICNDGSLARNGVHILDIIENHDDFQLASIIQVSEKIFNTESSGMVFVQTDTVDIVKNITITPVNPVIKRADLTGANLMLVDLQNIGIRYDVNFQVLISLLKISADSRIPMVLLDRPDPITATIMEGPLAVPDGLNCDTGIPWRFGMTLGEMALLINEEGWIDSQKAARVFLVLMRNYNRSDWYDQLGINWGIALDEVYTVENLLKYCSTCFYYFTNVSNGPGSLFQYEVGGAPWISGPVLLNRLNNRCEPYVEFSLVTFIPGVHGTAFSTTKYIGLECTGIRINVLDRDNYRCSLVGTYLLGTIAQMYSRHFRWSNSETIDALFGDDSYRVIVDTGSNIQQLYPVWISRLTEFQKLRNKYILY